MRRRARGGWVGWVITLILVGAGAWYWPKGGREQAQALYAKVSQSVSRKPSAAASAKPPAREIPVVAAVARSGDLPIHIDGLGTVTPFQTIAIRSRVDGELLSVLYKEGGFVKEGDLLAEIDPRPFQAVLAQAEGRLAQDSATLANARLDLQRYRAAGSVVPDQQRATQSALVNQLEGTIQADRALVDNARVQLSYTRITAPISGRVGLRRIDAGNQVRASDAAGLCVITQLQPIAILFSVPQDHIGSVNSKLRGDALLPVDAWDRDMKNKVASGSLLAVDNQVDQGTGTVMLKAKFENKDGALFPNQFVNARLLIETLKGVVIVPAAAIQRGPDSTFAYVVKADNTVEMRKIKQGPTEGDLTTVASGLKVGEVVVTDGADKLTQGTKVVPKIGNAASTPGAPAQDKGDGSRKGGKPPEQTAEASPRPAPRGAPVPVTTTAQVTKARGTSGK